MKYTFDILGVSPVLHFFNHQQEHHPHKGAEYIGSFRCTLDAFLESVETVPPKRGWDLDEVVDTVIHYWVKNSEGIAHWSQRLKDAGTDSLLVGRVANIKALKTEFESLLE
ncbi:hypothetical protein H6G20_24955 [Desertifilum sp. FACHB-1129]|uniref:Uncharacterized protein n=1 Tax=Desertifilum tharense IPPAS B-1220 TaxID=1781255 RepID=A0A1E5QLC1_9CYAN|nr:MULTISPECIES: hypothetical protein [Desertifilum]MDA0209311.1 hypothetical protein [Cyanobacteria bacterium FC1]MBD2314922.1 hypothetical protein [Desertifilum sp. FACHB-1129]MBD2325143.1 hypothetical protein [Desertifilum sp. FACHB-866]MBD2332715.1 hypothetical protein [Desertifilum sp. FACHB-868]OEJ75476.1 hypothetical protein BH720_09535 [Desertifilum tharense IPPAS B-1220]